MSQYCEAASTCGRPPVNVVTHPQRGALEVCRTHRDEIEQLPERNFSPEAGA
jgi:hypothetical protein